MLPEREREFKARGLEPLRPTGLAFRPRKKHGDVRLPLSGVTSWKSFEYNITIPFNPIKSF